jgi:type II secretion system protein D
MAAGSANTIIVRADPRDFSVVEEVISQLDKPQGPNNVQIFWLKNARANVVEKNIKDLFAQSAQSRGGRPRSVQMPSAVIVTSNSASNCVIVQAGRMDMQQIEQLVQSLDQVQAGGQEQVGLHVLPLKSAKADQLAQTLGRMLNEIETNRATREGVPPEKVSVSADTATNTLLVAGSTRQFEQVKELVEKLDKYEAGTQRQPWVVPLRNIDPNRAKMILDQLIPKTKSDASRGKGERQLSSSGLGLPVNMSLNAATAVVMTMIGSLEMPPDSRRLDHPAENLSKASVSPARKEASIVAAATTTKPAEPSSPPIVESQTASTQPAALPRVPQLSEAELKALAGSIQGPVEITSLPEQGSLIIFADEHDYQIISGILSLLEQTIPQVETEVFTLKNARAADLQRVLQQMYSQRRPPTGLPPATFAAETATNALIVTAPSDMMGEIRSIVDKLDAEPRVAEVDFKTFALKNARASQVGPQLEDMLKKILASRGQPEMPFTIISDDRTNTIIVNAPVTYMDQIERLISMFDSVPSYATVRLEIVRLKKVDADALAAVLNSLLTPEAQRGQAKELLNRLTLAAERDGEEFTLDLEKPIKVLPDKSSQTLAILSTQENLAALRRIIDLFDKVPLAGDLMVRIFPLKYADADETVKILDGLFQKGPGLTDVPGTGRKGGVPENVSGQALVYSVAFASDPRTNTVIVSGPEASVGLAEVLVSQLDKEKPAELYPIQLISLKNAQAADLQTVLQDMMDQRADRAAKLGTPKGAERLRVILRADLRTNTLLVSASAEDFSIIEQLVTQLDTAATLSYAPQLIPLSNLDAIQTAELLTDLFNRQTQARREQKKEAAIESAPIIVADARSKGLIVAASPQGLDEVKRLVERLDAAPIAKRLRVAVLPVKTADATQVAAALNELMQQVGGGGEKGGMKDALVLEFIQRTTEGQELINEAIKQELYISADKENNMLVVVAPEDTVMLIESLVRYIDQAAPAIEIRIFELERADATQMKKRLDEIFKVGKEGMTTGGPISIDGKIITPSKLERESLSIAADTRTNALIVTATPSYMELLREVITNLDARMMKQLQTEVLDLKNASAENIHDIISSLVENQTKLLKEAYGTEGIAPEQLLELAVNIVPDKESGKIILQGSPKYLETIKSIIDKLDQRPSQVMIQALFIEVSQDDRTEYGAEWVGQQLNFTKASGGTGIGPNHDVIVGTDLGAAGGTSLAGFTFTVNSEDFNVLLRALQSAGKLSVLSRPLITAKDNSEGMISVGQRVPIPTGAISSPETGNITTQIRYEDVALKLTVTPHVKSDNFVSLEVKTEISALSGSNIPISEGLSAPVYNTRQAETMINVTNGETVVMGGLITAKYEQRETKVPFLGDIPVLGYLFKSVLDVEEKTELLIVLTPRVIRTSVDARELTGGETFIMQLLPDKARNSNMLQTLLFRSAETTTQPATRPAGEGGGGFKPFETLPSWFEPE